MKAAPAWDALRGQSHPVATRVTLRRADGTEVADLPVEAGTVEANAADLGRWSGSLTLAGTEWAPSSAADPLSGLSGHYVEVQRGAALYGETESWVTLCRLWPVETMVSMSRRDAATTVRLESPAALAAQAQGLTYTPQQGETCQQFAVRILSQHLPFTPTVLDTSVATPVPASYEPTERPLYTVVDEVIGLADARLYFDALGRIVIRPALPALDVLTRATPAPLSYRVDVTSYNVSMGRSRFANDVIVRYRGTDQQTDATVGTAYVTTGPLRRDGPAGRCTVVLTRDVTATQAQADAYARSVLTAVQQGWVTVQIEAVPDPRVEPDDVIEAEYLDRTLLHRVVAVRYDLGTGPMTLTARTALPQET